MKMKMKMKKIFRPRNASFGAALVALSILGVFALAGDLTYNRTVGTLAGCVIWVVISVVVSIFLRRENLEPTDASVKDGKNPTGC